MSKEGKDKKKRREVYGAFFAEKKKTIPPRGLLSEWREKKTLRSTKRKNKEHG